VKRLNDLETENTRLRRAVSDLTLDKVILQKAARGYVAPYTLSPAQVSEHNELEKRKNDAQSHRDYDLWLTLDEEQTALGKFTPFMMHSFSEGARPVGFHFQVLADWNTVVEMADKFLRELRASAT